MRHLLMDPAFPDIVGEWAEEQAPVKSDRWNSANDNDDGEEEFARSLRWLRAPRSRRRGYGDDSSGVWANFSGIAVISASRRADYNLRQTLDRTVYLEAGFRT